MIKRAWVDTEAAWLKLTPQLSLALRVEAKRRGVERDELALALLHAVVTENLFAAVLDR